MEKATIERFFRKEAPKYMLGLVKDVRELNWIKESPLLRSKSINYSIEVNVDLSLYN